jgi:hypothetical protein
MLVPNIVARLKKDDHVSCLWISPGCRITFRNIAEEANVTPANFTSIDPLRDIR